MPYRVRQKHANVLLGAQFDQSGSCLELKKKSDQLVRGVDIFFRDQDWDESHRLGRLPERRPLVSGRVFDGVCTVPVPDSVASTTSDIETTMLATEGLDEALACPPEG